MGRFLAYAFSVIAFLLAACAAPASQGDRGASPDSGSEARRTNRVLTMAVRYEVTDLAPKIPGGGSPVITKRLFNAALALTDGAGAVRPYLAETLPQVSSDTWRVFSDGRMETTYRLRPDLTWQDGRPLGAADFVFAWRVYTHRGLGIFQSSPQDLMEAVLAPDPRTIVIRWHTPYPQAGALKIEAFDPLPQAILQQPFAALEQDPALAEVFLNHPYWTSEYVGAGPYKLTVWDPGSHLEGVAFDGHALGRPRIDRVIVRVIADENTNLSNVLAGTVDFTADFTLRFEHAQVLRRDWATAGRGTVVLKRSSPVSQTVQLRPEFVGDAALLDLRVRRALAHSIDRQALNEGVFEGQGFMTEHIVPEGSLGFAEVDRAVSKHLFDPRRSEQLMAEVGYARDREGFFTNAAGQRFKLDFRTFAGPEFERVQAIITDTWQRLGFDVQPSILSANLVRDREAAHTFPGLATRGGGLNERTWTSAEIGAPANRWGGNNRAGWSNADYDRLWEAYNTTLDQPERLRQFVEMQKLLSEHLPAFITYFAIQVNTHGAGLRGPDAGTSGAGGLVAGTLAHWNIHEWELA